MIPTWTSTLLPIKRLSQSSSSSVTWIDGEKRDKSDSSFHLIEVMNKFSFS
jgi:hypothetical protein